MKFGTIFLCIIIIFLSWLQEWLPKKNRQFWNRGMRISRPFDTLYLKWRTRDLQMRLFGRLSPFYEQIADYHIDYQKKDSGKKVGQLLNPCGRRCSEFALSFLRVVNPLSFLRAIVNSVVNSLRMSPHRIIASAPARVNP